MNREEQINKANPYDGDSGKSFLMAKFGFSTDAIWADENPISQWIKTKDQLPEDNELVLAKSKRYGVYTLVWNSSSETWNMGDAPYCNQREVDEWMRIPD